MSVDGAFARLRRRCGVRGNRQRQGPLMGRFLGRRRTRHLELKVGGAFLLFRFLGLGRALEGEVEPRHRQATEKEHVEREACRRRAGQPPPVDAAAIETIVDHFSLRGIRRVSITRRSSPEPGSRRSPPAHTRSSPRRRTCEELLRRRAGSPSAAPGCRPRLGQEAAQVR